MATKMEENILHVKGWVNGRITITVTRLYYRMIHRARVPSPLPTRDTEWESGLGLGFTQ